MTAGAIANAFYFLPQGGTETSVATTWAGDASWYYSTLQYRYAVDRWLWELVAGSLEPGEEAAAGAARECEEETGLVAGATEFLGSFYPTPGYCDEKMNFYRVTGLRAPEEGHAAAAPDEDEDLETRAFSLDEVREMIRSGEIEDLKTVVGITLAEARP